MHRVPGAFSHFIDVQPKCKPSRDRQGAGNLPGPAKQTNRVLSVECRDFDWAALFARFFFGFPVRFFNLRFGISPKAPRPSGVE